MFRRIKDAKRRLEKMLDPIHNYPIDNIDGIPTIATEDHHEVFPFWVTSGIKDATLLHIDAHDDIWDGVYTPEFSEHKGELFDIPQHVVDYTRCIDIANFICPAVHIGIVSSAYWLNPLVDEDEQLVDYGTTFFSMRRDLSTCETMHIVGSHISFKMPFYDNSVGMRLPLDYVDKDRIKVFSDRPFILDIDLDGFCCGPRPCDVERHVDIVNGYEQRIEDTGVFLRTLKRPDLITITRSQKTTDDEHGLEPYVPRDKVDDVQQVLMTELREIYAQNG
jgi:hypothetical protein